ncbi:hypothetical protein B0T12DRAFT_399328 [Alternaria alternata]|nr:hypothetical protein B0T12DRAFT_399328 [Alternaria alternata]
MSRFAQSIAFGDIVLSIHQKDQPQQNIDIIPVYMVMTVIVELSGSQVSCGALHGGCAASSLITLSSSALWCVDFSRIEQTDKSIKQRYSQSRYLSDLEYVIGSLPRKMLFDSTRLTMRRACRQARTPVDRDSAVLLANSEHPQHTSPGHHAAPGYLPQRQQRR